MWREVALAGAAAAGWMAWAVRGKSSTVFGPSIWRGPSSRRAVALTFDDGPSESTPALIDLLAELDVKATFFMCGAAVRRLPEIAREISLRGHETGNHSDSHAMFALRSPGFIHSEIVRAQDSIIAATGVRPVLFRAPFGVRWFGLAQALKDLELTGIMWTAMGSDWRLPPDAVARRLLARAVNGAIFCLHDGRQLRPNPDISSTLEAVRLVVPELKRRGYKLETVSRLLGAAPAS